MPRLLPTSNTVKRWIKDYPELQFDGTDLYCKCCKTVLGRQVKTRVLEHVSTDKHKTNKIGGVTAPERQRDFNLKFVEMMVECNIPWHTADNPFFKQFFQRCVTGQYSNIVMPEESSLGEHYLSSVCSDIQSKIALELQQKHIWVSVELDIEENSTNSRIKINNQNIANVFVGGMDEKTPMQAHLILSRVLEVTDAENIYNCITGALTRLWGENYQQNKPQVLLFITDSAPCMMVVAKHLKNTYPDLLHLTCLASGLNMIAQAVGECYPNVDRLITSLKKVFFKAPTRRKLFHETYPDVPPIPEPVINHWGAWINAASYYHIYFDKVKRVVHELNSTDTCIAQARQALAESTIQKDLAYIHAHFTRIPLALRHLECTTVSDYSIVNAVNTIFDLRYFIYQLSGTAADHVREQLETVLHNNSGFNSICHIVELLAGKEVNFSVENVNQQSLKKFMYFKYAPITTVDIERSFPFCKQIFNDRRRELTSEYLEQLLIIYFNSNKCRK